MTDKTVEAVAELKPCPFCGSNNIKLNVADIGTGTTETTGFIAICFDCFSQTDAYCNQYQALKYWNIRCYDSELKKHIKVLVEALNLLVVDVQDYPAWQRPCNALDIAQQALASLPEELRGL